MIGAVPVPGQYGKYDGPLDAGRIGGVREASKKWRFTRNRRAAPQLEPPLLGIVHEEHERTPVFGKVANADVLPVAGVFGKCDRALIQHFQESRRSSAVLDIRLTVGACGRKKCGIPSANERYGVRRKWLGKASRRSLMLIHFPRAATRLLGAHGRGEHHVVGLLTCFNTRRAPIRHRWVQRPESLVRS